MFKATSSGLALGLLLILAGAAQATMYLAESFDAYSSGASLSGQTGGTGFSGSAWSATIGSSGSITSTIDDGLTFSTYSSASGKSVKVATSGITSGWGDIYRPLAVTGTQEMWMTFLYKWNTPPAYTDGTAMYLDFLPTSGSPGDEPLYGVSLTNNGGLQLFGTYNAGTTNLHDGNVHMIIAKYWGDGSSGGKINNARLWTLTETEFNNVKNAPGKFTQANLDDNSLVSSTAKVSATSSSNRDLLSSSAKLELLRSQGTTSQWVDEFRVADSLGNLVLPEPATLALLGLGAAAMLLRRRRRTK